MNTYLQHALDLVIEGVLTQLPAQLITAAVAAAAVTWMSKRKKNPAPKMASPAVPGAHNNPPPHQAAVGDHIDSNRDASPGLGKP
ncbi:hypothetical protein ACFWPU_46245 [Streptomyces sp. NPDC058471]|uniref:hypothetical protein n=1 Tax=Streptomyces sp. NPDC058471 TaxID=3346516 RepID=UPI003657DEE4